MNLLLDTHALIWWMENNTRLGPRALAAIVDPKNDVWVSAVCIWEVSIKTRLGRIKFRVPFEECVQLELGRGFRSLPVTFALMHLPLGAFLSIHNDPFDRLLIAQAQCEELTLLHRRSLDVDAYDVGTLDASV